MKNGTWSKVSVFTWPFYHVYAQRPKKWTFERKLKVPLSIHSSILKWPFEPMLDDPKNDPFSICSMAMCAYAQKLFERTFKDPKNDTLRECTGHIFVVHLNLKSGIVCWLHCISYFVCFQFSVALFGICLSFRNKRVKKLCLAWNIHWPIKIGLKYLKFYSKSIFH